MDSKVVRTIKNCEIDVCTMSILGIIVGIFFLFYRGVNNELGTVWGLNYNYLAYFVTLFVSFAAFLLIAKLLNCKVIKGPAAFAVLLALIVYVFEMYRKESSIFAGGEDNLLRDAVDHKIYAVLLVSVSFFLIKIMKDIDGKVSHHNAIRVVYALLVSYVMGLLAYSLNIYKDSAVVGLWHIHAYVNSIINVFHGVPYSDHAQSIYGHYGIIYYPFVMLFGGNLRAAMISISLFTVITAFVAMLVLNKVIKNDLLFFVSGIALLAMEVIYRSIGQYFQVFPHRVMFPMLATGWVVLKNKIQKRYQKIIIELLLGTLALTWNVESGVFCVIAIVFVEFVEEFRFDIIFLLEKILLGISEIVICFLLSYCLTNLYCVSVGGNWIDLSTFIFPLTTENFTGGVLRTPFQAPIYWYVLYIFVFTSTLYPILFRKLFDTTGDKLSIEERVLLANNILGLMLLLYFINRQAFNNVTISYFQLVIALSILSNKFLEKEHQYDILNIISIILVCAMSLDCIISIGRCIDNRIATVWEVDSLARDAENFASWREDNAVAMGVGVPELYFYVGDDSCSAMTDWADMWDFTYVEEVLSQANKVYFTAVPRDEVMKLLVKYNYNFTREFEGENITISEFAKDRM